MSQIKPFCSKEGGLGMRFRSQGKLCRVLFDAGSVPGERNCGSSRGNEPLDNYREAWEGKMKTACYKLKS